MRANDSPAFALGAIGETAPLLVESRVGIGALASLRDEWRSLYERSCAPPFLSWEWITTWHRTLGAARTPRILCARRAGELVGLLPLAEEARSLFRGAKLRRLSFLGERWGGADYLDVLAPAGGEAAAAEAILGHLRGVLDFDVIDLDGIAADSKTLPIFAGPAGETGPLRTAITPRHICPQIELQGSWDDVLARSKRADNFKRRLRQIRQLEGFERRVVRDPAEAVAAWERFLLLHEARWADVGGSDAMGRPAIQAFHREMVVGLAERGWLRFEEIWAEGACRASIYGIDNGATYCFYQSGYDPAWAKRSVGLICLGLSIEDALARGIRRYDFLRGTESYKFDWATGTRETVAVRLAVDALPAKLLRMREGAERAARAAAHAFLPRRAVEKLRRLRRIRERET